MTIKSVFDHATEIPKIYTCFGPNVNPPLFIDEVPEEAQSLVLMFEDLNSAPLWTHWMLFNIPVTTTEIKEGTIPEGAVEGLANNHTHGYEGPCPKYFEGIHHYRYRLFALDTVLDLPAATERDVVEQQMQGHVVAKADLEGICNSNSPMFKS